MEIEVPSSSSTSNLRRSLSSIDIEKDKVRVKRKTLKTVLEQCQRALQSLNDIDLADDGDDDDEEQESNRGTTSVESPIDDREAYELCDLLKSRVDCADFLEKLETAQVSCNLADWDMICENDLWADGEDGSNQDDYVLVRQEDIVEGISCFMAAYLLSLKHTKDLTPNQLQEALTKTFSVKKKKGKLRKAWDGSKVIYNVASWGATAIGLYQNPVILRAATKAFWTSCHVISKLL